MTTECATYLYRAIINNLNGNVKEFERLTKLAMKHNEEMTCSCGAVQAPCKYRYNKYKYEHGFACTKCGRVVNTKGIVITKGRKACLLQA